jgi:thiamine-phosphate pyrophosphorylase
MITRRQAAKRPAPRLYLVTQRIDDAGALLRPFQDALGAADVAAVLLRMAEADRHSLVEQVRTLAPVVQHQGVALVLDGRAEIVAEAAADGAHLCGSEALKHALPSLKPDRIAGVGALWTRHDAMLAGEAGADYVMFGEPAGNGGRPPFPAVVERVAWWSEVFEVPCVGFAASMDEAEALARAGAEFVALGEFVWSDPRGPAAAVAAAGQRLSALELP